MTGEMEGIQQRIRVIDSHTGGEPTRLVLDGGPDLGKGSLAGRRDRFRDRFDGFRSAVINEPRGSDVIVGALLCEPNDASCAAAVIFFNNASYLGMCGHGMIGVIATLAHLGRIEPGEHRIETPVGPVTGTLHADGRIAVRNVASYRLARDVTVEVEGHGSVTGDVAWGGNWFFLTGNAPVELTLENVRPLTEFTEGIRRALARSGVTGEDGAVIDHIEVFGPPRSSDADSRNFVLCPGGAYDRSPCGTGTSARMACLAADGRLQAGQVWRQEGILGTILEGSIERDGDRVLPTISGTAYVTAESTLILDPSDPFCLGIR